MRVVGIRQSGPRHAAAESHVIQLAAHRPKASFDIAKALAISQLSERHRQILIATREASSMSITAIACDTFLKLVGGQMVHQLSEDSLTEIHPSLSERRRGPSAGFSRLKLRRKNSNRKNQIQPQVPDFTWLILRAKSLAGQQCKYIEAARRLDPSAAAVRGRRDGSTYLATG